jgi:trigger factor
MDFKNVNSNGTRYECEIILKAADIEDNLKKAISEKAKTFKMQGFRPGHVPFEIVRKHVEAGILPDVFKTMINNACAVVIKEMGITDVATQPAYRFNEDYENGKDAKLTIFIEAVPIFELKEFKCKITKIIPLIKDEDITKLKKDLMKFNPVFGKAEKNYCVNPGDKISYFVQCIVNGVISKKKSFENSAVISVENFEHFKFLENFIGKKVGETFNFDLETEKNTIYKCTIKYIKKALLDLPFEEYAKKKGFKDAEELEKVIIDDFEKSINESAFIYHKCQILDALANEYDFDLPKSIVEQETKNVIANIRREIENEKRQGITNNKDLDKSDEELVEKYESVIKKRVLLGYILNKFARKYGITVSDDEVRRSIFEETHRNPEQASDIIAHYTGNHAAITYKRAEIVEKKVIEFLINLSECEEIKKTKEEVEKFVDEVLAEE